MARPRLSSNPFLLPTAPSPPLDSVGKKTKNKTPLPPHPTPHRCREEFDMAAGPGLRPPQGSPLPSTTWPHRGGPYEDGTLPTLDTEELLTLVSPLEGPPCPSRAQPGTSLPARLETICSSLKSQHWVWLAEISGVPGQGPWALKEQRACPGLGPLRWAMLGFCAGWGLRPLHTSAHTHTHTHTHTHGSVSSVPPIPGIGPELSPSQSPSKTSPGCQAMKPSHKHKYTHPDYSPSSNSESKSQVRAKVADGCWRLLPNCQSMGGLCPDSGALGSSYHICFSLSQPREPWGLPQSWGVGWGRGGAEGILEGAGG